MKEELRRAPPSREPKPKVFALHGGQAEQAGATGNARETCNIQDRTGRGNTARIISRELKIEGENSGEPAGGASAFTGPNRANQSAE